METFRCQRIGCEATFTNDDNVDGVCTYHESGPKFHDGMKEWSCCKKRSHDFNTFLAIPGCKTGIHTTEKPVLAKVAVASKKPISVQASLVNSSSKDNCSRCRQGFFCSDHGSQAPGPNTKSSNFPRDTPDEGKPSVLDTQPLKQKKVVDIKQPQICKNKGCGKTFIEKDNHDEACNYHPGPAVFHDRLRGWKCCDIHVKEFDEFVSVPPCAKGWHDADPK